MQGWLSPWRFGTLLESMGLVPWGLGTTVLGFGSWKEETRSCFKLGFFPPPSDFVPPPPSFTSCLEVAHPQLTAHGQQACKSTVVFPQYSNYFQILGRLQYFCLNTVIIYRLSPIHLSYQIQILYKSSVLPPPLGDVSGSRYEFASHLWTWQLCMYKAVHVVAGMTHKDFLCQNHSAPEQMRGSCQIVLLGKGLLSAGCLPKGCMR